MKLPKQMLGVLNAQRARGRLITPEDVDSFAWIYCEHFRPASSEAQRYEFVETLRSYVLEAPANIEASYNEDNT